MSRTDKDITRNVHYILTGLRWYELGNYDSWRYVPGARPSFSRTRHEYVRHYWHRERFKVRMALWNGEEPEPSRTRHSVLWDLD